MDVYPLYFLAYVSPYMCTEFLFRICSCSFLSNQSALLCPPMVHNTWCGNHDIYVGGSWNMVASISYRETLDVSYTMSFSTATTVREYATFFL